MFIFCEFVFRYQDFLGDDFKSQGSHVPYNVADFSTQVYIWRPSLLFSYILRLDVLQCYLLIVEKQECLHCLLSSFMPRQISY